MKEGLSEAVTAGVEESLAGTQDIGRSRGKRRGILWSLGIQRHRPCAVGI